MKYEQLLRFRLSSKSSNQRLVSIQLTREKFLRCVDRFFLFFRLQLVFISGKKCTSLRFNEFPFHVARLPLMIACFPSHCCVLLSLFTAKPFLANTEAEILISSSLRTPLTVDCEWLKSATLHLPDCHKHKNCCMKFLGSSECNWLYRCLRAVFCRVSVCCGLGVHDYQEIFPLQFGSRTADKATVLSLFTLRCEGPG